MSGVLFAVTQDNHQLRVGLTSGAIVHVALGPRRGRAALESIIRTATRTATFSPGPCQFNDTDLPPVDALLKLLAPPLSSGKASEDPAQRPPTLRTDTLPMLPSVSPGQLAALREVTLESLGPIGGLLVDQAIAAGPASFQALVAQVAKELSSDAERKAFEAALAARLAR